MSAKERIPSAFSPLFRSIFVTERIHDFRALAIEVDNLGALPVVERRRGSGRGGNGHVEGRRHCARQTL